VARNLYVLDRGAADRKTPSHVVFNSHVNALKDQLLMANAGEWVRLYVHNIGPSDGGSTHVVGTILDRVWYEGNPLNEWRSKQTVPLGASNGAVGLDPCAVAAGQVTRHTAPMSH
jgi:nitrite reductase (NO-forming)